MRQEAARELRDLDPQLDPPILPISRQRLDLGPSWASPEGAVNLTHTQTRTTSGGYYRVVDTVTAATDIPSQVFVFRTDDQAFSRVAAVDDLRELPDTREAAVADSCAYYRAAEVSRDYESMSTAADFAAALKRDLKYLVVEYNKAVTLFLGTDTETLAP